MRIYEAIEKLKDKSFDANLRKIGSLSSKERANGTEDCELINMCLAALETIDTMRTDAWRFEEHGHPYPATQYLVYFNRRTEELNNG